MKTRLCFTHDESMDSIVLEADTLEELQELARKEVIKRKPDEFWSEEVD